MARTLVRLEDMVIPSGQDTSNAIRGFENALAVWIYSPAALTGTITVQVEPTESGSSFVALTSGGSDVTIGAGKCLPISPVAALQFRLKSGATEGAARTFTVLKRAPA